MLSNGFEIPIQLKPVSSKLYCYFVLSTHAMAIIALLHPSSLPPWLRLLLVVCVVASGIYHIRRRAGVNREAWVWQHSGVWKREQDNMESNWRLSRIFSLTRLFVVLRLVNDAGQREDVLWFRDQFDADCFRRLRVRLRFFQVDATRPGETI